jgi:hypothetical protein
MNAEKGECKGRNWRKFPRLSKILKFSHEEGERGKF